MAKTLEQIVLDGQAAQCGSLEELFVLWELAQQIEAERGDCSKTCVEGLNPRNFHVDGIISEKDYRGVLYLMKEPSLKQYLARGGSDSSLPVVTDLRPRILREGKRREPAFEYLAGMQRILFGEAADEKAAGEKAHDENSACEKISGEMLKTAAIVYVNKRGGRENSDDIYWNYGNFYIEFLKREIRLLRPRLIVCCGEELFRLTVKEVFCNKKKIRNRGEYMIWKNYVDGALFHADKNFKPVKQRTEDGVTVLNMWSPAYRMNGERYISLREYLKEFAGRAEPVKFLTADRI